MFMRVIAGDLRRRKLEEVMSDTTRSTRDRVKESLFNMLTPLVQYEKVLDAFAGSGALGIEALSRGSKSATFIEQDKNAFNVLQNNIKSLNLYLESSLYLDNTLNVLQTLNQTFDLILLDPPYHTPLINESLQLIAKHTLLSTEGCIVVLSANNYHFELNDQFKIIKQKTKGITTITLIEWSD